jgi:integrase
MNSRVLLPKHVRRVRAKGKNYYYFNTGMTDKGKVVWKRLPDVRSDEFGGAYAAMLGHRSRRAKPGALTIPQLIDLYERSPAYRDLAKSSQKNYGIYLRHLAKLLPTAPAAEVTRGHMRRLIDKMADTPGAANLFLGTCGALFKWAVGNEHIAASPTKGIPHLKMGEHQPWPMPVLNAALSARDDQVRLLTHLLYYTALRINDALSLTWGNIEGNAIVVRPQKSQRRGQVLRIPLHKALAGELAKLPRKGMVIAVNPNTKRRYSEGVARDLLQEFAAALGAKVVPHGLRKNAVNALLEIGCSVAETAAISGQTLQLVEHYAKQRDQQKLAEAAVLKWEGNAS